MGRHRKLSPPMWNARYGARGDGSDLRLSDTPLGKIGGLNCWEHLQPLTRYAMYSLGQQIHIAAWPAFSLYRKYAFALGDVASVGATRHYALEGGCFALMAVSVISREMVERLADTPERADLIEIGGGASQIFGPDGATLAGPPREDEEAIVTAEVDLGRYRSSEELRRPGRRTTPGPTSSGWWSIALPTVRPGGGLFSRVRADSRPRRDAAGGGLRGPGCGSERSSADRLESPQVDLSGFLGADLSRIHERDGKALKRHELIHQVWDVRFGQTYIG